VPVPDDGYRSYLAVNGDLDAPRILGSVAPDRLLEIGTRLAPGDSLAVESRYAAQADDLGGLFRLGAAPQPIRLPARVPVTGGPELDRLVLGAAALDQTLRLLPQSDEVGLRFEGAPLERNRTEEILSRGVPLGAVEVVPDGSLLVLMRGRLVTAGYPVVAVVTTTGLDQIGQLRPGDEARLELVELADARADVRHQAAARDALAERVRTAFTARGLGAALYCAR
jgi:allophanate hydrolase subunit 2